MASFSLKPLDQQVIVITGASSGIGLTTARMAAQRGAKVVLAARNEAALQEIVGDIEKDEGQAIAVGCDVANADELHQVHQKAMERFGGIDTWVNNAGVSIYGEMKKVPIEDNRRLFETNFWGVVQGSLEAAEHFRKHVGRDSDFGGVIINIGSVLSDRAIPLQGMYSASKHAVKGFTEALRMELEDEGLPCHVTLIKPSAIDTPYAEHAKNYMDKEATLPPPVYKPEVVARAILHAAEHHERDLYVGGGGRMLAGLGRLAPRTMDQVMEWVITSMQKEDRPAGQYDENSLYGPSHDGSTRGHYGGYVRGHSFYTQATMHPLLASLAIGGLGVLAATVLGGSLWSGGSDADDRRRRRREHNRGVGGYPVYDPRLDADVHPRSQPGADYRTDEDDMEGHGGVQISPAAQTRANVEPGGSAI